MTNTDDHEQESRALQNWLLLLYLLFVVYGSLVPLQYVDRPWDDAVQAFRNIPFLTLGIDSRADWVANGVLYVPVGFLTAQMLIKKFKDLPLALLLVIAGGGSMALAVTVEFVQLFFPQRTVSLNDILAECLGSLIGLALSARYAHWFGTLIASLVGKPQRLTALALDGYVFAYLAFALFPYDFVVSWSELAARLDSDSWGWLIAGSSPRPVLLILHLVAEVGLTLPFGFLLARRAGLRFAHYRQAALIGLLLGSLIEVLQFLMASGVAQGLSVLTRVAGVCGGLALSRYGHRWTPEQIALVLRRYTPALAAAYLTLLLELNGWLASDWHGLNGAVAQLAQVKFMPFYYHYFTTEALALFSLGVVSISYTPVALLAWAHRRSAAFVAVVASVIAMGIESGKLFIQGLHPDPTNILLACAASWLTARFLQLLGPHQSMPTLPLRAPRPWLLLYLLAAGVWLAAFPVFPVFVGVVLITGAALVWHRPVWVFALIAAALPVFDLAPWSGRFFLDEFDALLLVSLAVAYSRVPAPRHSRAPPDAFLRLAVTSVVLSFAISSVRGLLPLQLPDANSFNNYFSAYNALRIVKGACWAAVVAALSRRFVAAGVDARRPFGWGLTVGLALTVAVVIWERIEFSELWNFSDGYRVTGPFSAGHTGGAYLDSFLAAAIPSLIILTLEKRHWLLRLGGVSLVLASTYALMVTFSRGGYLAFALAVCIVLLAWTASTSRLARRGVISIGLAGVMLLVAVPIYKGEFLQSRMEAVSTDLAFRQARWQDALGIRDPGWATSLFGMGLGRFPETKFWRSTLDPKVGTYQLRHEAGSSYLRLDSGDAIGVEQFVSLQPGQQYVLSLDVRPSRPGATLTVPICEKWLLTSFNCLSPTFDLGAEFGAWRSIETRFSVNANAANPWFGQRPRKLALTYAVAQSTIDIDNVRLEHAHNGNLLRNGDFSQGLDQWFFATAGSLHAHWRVHSLFFGVLFDQGWFGLVALNALLLLAAVRAAQKAWRGDALSGASLAALVGFLAGGVFDTQIDASRFLLLLLLLAWACLYPVAPSKRGLVFEKTMQTH